MLVEKNNLRKKIRKAQVKDERVVKVVEELKKTGMKILKDKKWIIEEEIVMKER